MSKERELELAGNLIACVVARRTGPISEVLAWFQPEYLVDPLALAIFEAVQLCHQRADYSAAYIAEQIQAARKTHGMDPGEMAARFAELMDRHRGLWWNYRWAAISCYDDWRTRCVSVEAGNEARQLQDGESEVESTLEQLAGLRSKYAPPVDLQPSSNTAAIEELLRDDLHTDDLDTGIAPLDRILGGISPGSLLVVGARTGCGKSSWMGHVAAHQAFVRQNPVLLFSLEMSMVQVYHRMAVWKSHTGDKGSEIYREACRQLKDSETLTVFAGSFNVGQLEAKVRGFPRLEHCRLIVVDYLQLVRPSTKRVQQSREQQVSEVARQLKQLALDTGKVVVAGSQLSRAAAADQTPKLHHLRESGAIEQDADQVLLLDPQDPSEITNCRTTIVVAKNRNGETGVCDVSWVASKFRYAELAYNDDGDAVPVERYSEFDAFNEGF